MKKGIGRKCRIVDCRETAGLAKTGGLAQRNTVAESPSRDVIAIAMGPGRRHITKPICEITYALREEGIDTSVIVLNAGSGVPTDAPARTMGTFGLEPEEIKKIEQFKLAVIHLGNVKNHIIYKARLVLRNVDIPAICVTQCPVDFEDFASIGIKTRKAMPPDNETKTKGEVVEIVSGIIRGEACPQSKLDEVIRKVKENLIIIEQKTGEKQIAE
ncbi:methyl-coenzyme M reductase I operon protein C [Methanonatronarchaeum sp. AMET-Sl]|uniref:methyl-coenzyme M reductase I operon protein C n=1 Tax=Methanonatronarchaeum sp. AMET-Sl TaxID=3037654 RepID=UPI00244DFF35|nr:methyl-coenzyme M reductase I operon protein C [Methanonatronarchaeum sp. AMET-Sl]WGI17834.1 methyl-coenzyme M reductase I operon protein C [Methanonatronarchaeum sp. AMET-Sl]